MEPKRNGVDPFGTVRVVAAREPVKLIGLCFLISVFIAILYFNSLGNQFTNWDDGMIYQNSSIRNLNWVGIKKIFTFEHGNTYQPIRVLSYAIDYWIWKLNPLGYHITNILFYILTCIMVFFTLFYLSNKLRTEASADSHGRVAFLGALLFAAHPVHVEGVTWLAARKEVLQGFFLFTAFFLYLKGRENQGQKRVMYLLFVLISVLLATLSKPSAIVFPGLLLIYEIASRRHRWFDFSKEHWIFFAVSVCISLIFLIIIIKVLFEAGGVKPYRGGSFFANFLLSFYVFIYNIKLLIWTLNYSAAYTIPLPPSILSPRTFIFIGITLLFFILSFWSLKKTKIIFFCFLFFFVTVFPYLNILPISTLLADRYVFIASFSYVFLLGVLFDRLYTYKHKKFSESFFKLLSITLFLFLLTVYSLMTVRQNKIWENSYTLWADAVEKNPGSNTANALMGVVYMELAMDRNAVGYLEKAVQLLPYDYQSRNNLAIVYGRLDEPEKALQQFATAMQLRPDDDTIKINLSVFYQRQKEYKKAEDVLKYLLSKNPQNANLHYRLGLVYKDAGDYEASISELKKCMELTPHIINPYEELGNIYASRLKDLEKAKHYYTKGIEAVPKAKSRVEDLRWMIQDLENGR